jgi:hypothetical protein
MRREIEESSLLLEGIPDIRRGKSKIQNLSGWLTGA